MAPPERRVFVTGATGFVGRLLCLRLARDGVRVVAWVRSKERARSILGPGPELCSVDADASELRRELSRCDAVVNLAGAGLFDRRWNAERKRELAASRVDVTRGLVEAMSSCAERPSVWIQASAIGWYGARGDEALDESAERGHGFLPDLCEAWEAAALRAESPRTRVATLRIGIVLGAGGGALARMLPPFRFGVGGTLGDGAQWMSWIHMSDLVELIVAALRTPELRGPINAVAPEACTNRELTRTLAAVLRRPALVPAPAPLLRAVLGESAGVLVSGQRVVPTLATEAGFHFRFPTLESALRDLCGPIAGLDIRRADAAPSTPYFARVKPRYLLEQRTRIPASLPDVFRFFGAAENLGAITPPSMRFEVTSERPIEMREGTEIDYRVRVGPLRLRWRSRIEIWRPGEVFVDSQLIGPYARWWHEHRFTADGEGTSMEDRVWYTPPLGWIGALAQPLFIAPELSEVFRYRSQALRMRFGDSGTAIARAGGPPAVLAPFARDA